MSRLCEHVVEALHNVLAEHIRAHSRGMWLCEGMGPPCEGMGESARHAFARACKCAVCGEA
jgi:hypothetical protein